MKEIQEAQEVLWYYFTGVRALMSGDSKCELIAAFNLGAGYVLATEYRRRYKEEKEKADFFLAVECECNNLHNLLVNRKEDKI